MTRVMHLLELQELDLRRDNAIARLREIVAALEDDRALEEARAAHEKAEEALADVERRLRTEQRERDAVKAHLERERKKLYGGKYDSPKELENLQLEVSSLERRLDVLDDRALELMLERDEAEETLAAAAEALEHAEAAAAESQRTLKAERRELSQTIRQLESKRETLTERVAAADLSTYQRLRKRTSGRALAQLSNGHCAVCGMKLPVGHVTSARSGTEIVTCTSCGRILHG